MKTKSPPQEVIMALRHLRVEPWAYRSHDAEAIYTSQGTILYWQSRPRFADVTAGPTVGNNRTGHRLPASGHDDA